MPDPYGLKNDEVPRARYIPLPDERPERMKRGRRRNQPFWVRLMEWDPFPFIMSLTVLMWVGLGLGARRWPWLGLVLVAAGLFVFVLGQLYLYALIFRDDSKHGALAMLFDWYLSIYLHFNIELIWKPMLISGCGILMMLTGTFGTMNHPPR